MEKEKPKTPMVLQTLLQMPLLRTKLDLGPLPFFEIQYPNIRQHDNATPLLQVTKTKFEREPYCQLTSIQI